MRGMCQKCDCWVRFPVLHPLSNKRGECQLAPLKIAFPVSGGYGQQTVWADMGEDEGCHSFRSKVEAVLAEFRSPLAP